MQVPTTGLELRDIFAIVAFIVALGSFLHAQFIQKAKDQERLNNVDDAVRDITALQQEIKEIHKFLNETVRPTLPQIDLFWRTVQAEFPKMMLHDGETIRDRLLMKLSNNSIRMKELEDLEAIIDNEYEHLTVKSSTEGLINRMTSMIVKKCKKDPRAD